ncbi:MAG: S8/S53 family peptidase [Nocardioides sp.]|nr:S8/S53 family peptidase [Nocardioides sp.]
MRQRAVLRTTLAAAAIALTSVPAWSTPAAAANDAPCDVSQVPGSERLADADTEENGAFDRMHVVQAQELARGRGTKIAVLDSGVLPDVPGLARLPFYTVPGASPQALLSGHGTIVAGLIAGKDGVAPEATVYDVKVFDAEGADPTEGQKPVTSSGIVAGIEAVIAAQPREQFDVVNISLAVRQSDPALESAIARLVALDVVVVASAGNKEVDADATGFEGTEGNDADIYPADYPGVLAVSALAPGADDPSTYVVPNLDTDVAAPTLGAVSVNATGQRCVIVEIATSWAAAEVSGIVALLREQFPRETPQQIVARLQATTEGSGAPTDPDEQAEDPWTGAGVVQAHDALTRVMKPGRQGKVERSVAETRADAQAPPPPERIDLFTEPRAILLWEGLGAGALLALAFMLRPLIRR